MSQQLSVLQAKLDALNAHLAAQQPKLHVAAPGQTLTKDQIAFNFCATWPTIKQILDILQEIASLFPFYKPVWGTYIAQVEAFAGSFCPVPTPGPVTK